DEWGLTGFVVSDWLDIARLHSVHAIAETRKEADRLALSAGVDMHMHGGEFFDNVLALVREGAISEARIDAAVLPILYAKFQLGLFERRYSEPARVRATLRCPAHLAVALEASRKSLVLLTNTAGILPLRNVRSLCVTGPDADDQSILGDWARLQPAQNVVTVKQGLIAQAPSGVRVEYVATGPIAQISDEQIAAAVKAAAQTDVTIVVIGENSLRDNHERTSGENVDRASLEPPGRQLELVRALVATGKPIVAVLVNGAPIASEWLAEHAAAVLEAWEPGAFGGQAIAEALFGQLNPSGRLPMTVPRSTGHLKNYYNHRPSAHHRGKYRFSSYEPLFRFGHGLSYTRFEYSQLRSRDELSAGEELVVEVDVKNAGARAGEDIVLLFVRDVFASVTRPVKELRAFERVALEPGEKKTVRFVLGPEAFSLFDRQLKKTIEPGEFRLLIGLGGPEKSVWVTS
ncbi:MAG TPA: glycoside hydrolase family 3 C-terminal domain-containing protein, partial [Polyangiaceae bacterium]|nr:glycoside hydrolase family 3 C-terminal domain-containing protein [Polyangiaceae bacterium]